MLAVNIQSIMQHWINHDSSTLCPSLLMSSRESNGSRMQGTNTCQSSRSRSNRRRRCSPTSSTTLALGMRRSRRMRWGSSQRTDWGCTWYSRLMLPYLCVEMTGQVNSSNFLFGKNNRATRQNKLLPGSTSLPAAAKSSSGYS